MGLRPGRMPRIERRLDADLPPAGLETGLAAAGVVVAAIVAACLPASTGNWRLVPVAAALLAIGALTRHARVPAFAFALAALVVDGFLVDRLGELSWHGVADAYRLLFLAASAGLGLLLGVLHRQGFGLQAARQPSGPNPRRRWWHRPSPLTVPPEWAAVDGVVDDGRATSRKKKEEVPRG